MHTNKYIQGAPYIGASFLILFTITTSIFGMESELKQRLLINNSNDTTITIEQQHVEDCGICYEEKEVIIIPCKEGDKHPKICSVCLDGCNELCPYCRGDLIIEKKRHPIIKDMHDPSSHNSPLQLGVTCGCLTIYLCIFFTMCS